MNTNYNAMRQLLPPIGDLPTDIDVDLQVYTYSLDRLTGIPYDSPQGQRLGLTADQQGVLDRLLQEMDPLFCSADPGYGLLTDYRRVYGLPPGATAAQLLVQMGSKRGLNKAFFYGIASRLGYNINDVYNDNAANSAAPSLQIIDGQYPPFRADFSHAGDKVYDNYLGANPHNMSFRTWTVTRDIVSATDTTMQNLFQLLKPAGSDIVFALPADVAADFEMNDGAGAVVSDSSANANNGAWIGAPAWGGAGRFGGAAALVSLDNYISVPHRASLAMTSALSVAARVWFNGVSAQSASGWMFLAGKYFCTESGWCGWQMNVKDDGTLQFSCYVNDGNAGEAHSTIIVPVNSWVVVAAILNGTGLHLYIDGAEVTSIDTPYAGAFADSGNPLSIGACQQSRFFNGYVDWMRLYNRGLSSAEVSGLSGPS